MKKPSSNAILLNAVFNAVVTKRGLSETTLKLMLPKDTATGTKSLQTFFYNLRVEDGKTYTQYVQYLQSSPKASTCSLEDALIELVEQGVLLNNTFTAGKTIGDTQPSSSLVTSIADKLYDFSYTVETPAP